MANITTVLIWLALMETFCITSPLPIGSDPFPGEKSTQYIELF